MASDALTTPRLDASGPDHAAAVGLIYAAGEVGVATTGMPPTDADVHFLFEHLPLGCARHDQCVPEFFSGEHLAGVADVVCGWNATNIAICGLLLLRPAARRRGYGRLALAQIATLASRWPSVNRLRIGVVASHQPALAFWRYMGFTETGEIKARSAPSTPRASLF